MLASVVGGVSPSAASTAVYESSRRGRCIHIAGAAVVDFSR